MPSVPAWCVVIDFRDTWKFLDHRIKDAFDLRKTAQEVSFIVPTLLCSVSPICTVFSCIQRLAMIFANTMKTIVFLGCLFSGGGGGRHGKLSAGSHEEAVSGLKS